jgi:hypothetical protein
MILFLIVSSAVAQVVNITSPEKYEWLCPSLE